MKKKLTPKELDFCNRYVLLQNYREAAVKAGFAAEEAEREGLRLLALAEVQREIRRLADKSGRERGLAGRVTRGLERLAFGSCCDAAKLLFLEESPGAEELEKMDLFSVAELKRGKNGVEVKLFDRFKAMEMLAKLDGQEEQKGESAPLYRAILGSLDTACGDVEDNDV